MATKLKVGLAGFGLSGSVFHAPFLNFLAEFELTKICSSKKEMIQTKYPKTQVVSDFSELLTDEIDLIIITTPNHLHFPQAKAALEAGKHVLVEKPFTPTVEEGEQLIEISKQVGKVLSVFHNRRFDGDFLTVKKLIEENVLGDVVYFESHFDRFRPQIKERNWREKKDTAAGGVLFDLGAHLIDQAYLLFGEPKEVIVDKEWQRTGSEQDDYFHVIMKYERLRVVLQASCIAAKPGPKFLIHGTNGSFEIHGLDPQESRLKEGVVNLENIGKRNGVGKLYFENSSGDIEIEDGNYKEFYKMLYNCIVNGGDNPASAQESLFNLKVILQES